MACYMDQNSANASDVRRTLQRTRDYSITFSSKRSVFANPEVEFCRYTVNSSGFTVDPAKTAAIQEFPTPANQMDLQLLLGLTNQCSEFSSRLSDLRAPLQLLIKQTTEFLWDATHDAAFNSIKTKLVSLPVLAFQVGANLRLQTDASALKGLVFALWQLQDKKWHLIQCGSHFLSDAEPWYAIIELELLAVIWAVH